MESLSTIEESLSRIEAAIQKQNPKLHEAVQALIYAEARLKRIIVDNWECWESYLRPFRVRRFFDKNEVFLTFEYMQGDYYICLREGSFSRPWCTRSTSDIIKAAELLPEFLGNFLLFINQYEKNKYAKSD